MDDLKTYAEDDDDLESLLIKVKRFNDDDGMQFGQKKRRTLHLEKACC